MSNINKHVDRLLQELRRGTITIAVLSQLDEPHYGYSLVSILKKKSIHVEAGTLYPLLRRLEKQGLLQSEWDTTESRPRKYYMLSSTGKEVFKALQVEWQHMFTNVDHLIKGVNLNGNS